MSAIVKTAKGHADVDVVIVKLHRVRITAQRNIVAVVAFHKTFDLVA